MATEDEMEVAVESITDDIETLIAEQSGSGFKYSQEESVDILRDIETWCRDRRQGIQEEIG